MELIGKATIHPLAFYSGKFSGYATWTVALLAWSGVPRLPLARLPELRLLALALGAAGLLLAAASLAGLGRSTRLGLPATPTAFRTKGVYRFSRNPMYLGFDLLTLGAVAGSPHAVTAALGLYSVIVYHFIILGEERFLRRRFGAEFEEYAAKVGRYV